MTDLYEILGVDRKATPADIAAAYRREAKSAHPDAGGDSETFNALAVAKRVLSDPDKRARYDQTGRIDDQPDARQSKALETVASIITQLIELPDAIHSDLVAQAAQVIAGETSKQMQAKAKAQADLEQTIQMRKRFKAKKGKIDRIGSLLDTRADAIRQVLTQMDEQVEVLKIAQAIVADQTFDVEPRAYPMQQWGSATSAGSSTMLGGLFPR